MAVNTTGAIFLDRDGVINENLAGHVKSWAEFKFIPEALESIRRLTETGLPIFIVTNQGMISRGQATIEALQDIHQKMLEQIHAAGGAIKHVYFCPHDSACKCACRKPEPGMLTEAAEAYDVDLTQSFMVGDAWTDVQAGLSVGARSIFVLTGRGAAQYQGCWDRFPVRFATACDISGAADIILSSLKQQQSDSVFRLRNAFHMPMNLNELIVI
jgi:D-glycero-D-manno-heptose 1,7-bisphosphate phosphatase